MGLPRASEVVAADEPKAIHCQRRERLLMLGLTFIGKLSGHPQFESGHVIRELGKNNGALVDVYDRRWG